MKTGRQLVALKDIRLDGQHGRVRIREDYVSTYFEDYQDGAKMPPIVLFHDGTLFWVGDGWHRLTAKIRSGAKEVDAIVKSGTAKDAILFNIQANSKPRGIPMSTNDRVHACKILMADKEYSFWTDERIAKLVGCSVNTAHWARESIVQKDGVKQPDFRISSTGRIFKTPAKKEVIPKDKLVTCPTCRGAGKILKEHTPAKV